MFSLMTNGASAASLVDFAGALPHNLSSLEQQQRAMAYMMNSQAAMAAATGQHGQPGLPTQHLGPGQPTGAALEYLRHLERPVSPPERQDDDDDDR